MPKAACPNPRPSTRWPTSPTLRWNRAPPWPSGGDGKLTVHTGTQRPFGVKEELVSALGLKEDQVRVIMPDTGSGYGGKHSGEAAIEAARLARRGRRAGAGGLDARRGVRLGLRTPRRRD